MRILESYKHFGDMRGEFLGIINDGRWEEINYVETESGQVRGGHYHADTQELFFIIEGDIEIQVVSIDGRSIQKFTAQKGYIFVVEPLEVHIFKCLTRSKWINVLSKRMDDNKPDFHRA